MAVDSSTPRQATPEKWQHPLGVKPRLVAASALMLFLELALIRWTGSNVVHLSYFSNFVLLGSFLGIGVGILRSSRAKRLPYYSPVMLGLLVAVIAWKPVTVNRGTDSSVIYFTSLNTTGPPTWVILPIIFVAAAVVLAGPAELVGRCFADLPRLTAYRFDLIGSLVGIVAFTALSFLGAPPIWWGADRHGDVRGADAAEASWPVQGDRDSAERHAGARADAGDGRRAVPRVDAAGQQLVAVLQGADVGIRRTRASRCSRSR